MQIRDIYNLIINRPSVLVWPITILLSIGLSVFSATVAVKIMEKTQTPSTISISYPEGYLDLPMIKPAAVIKKTAKPTKTATTTKKTKPPIKRDKSP